jgi:diguanylate cyclase
MGAGFHGLEAAGMHKVLCLLEPLRQSPTGAVIYRQVERMLEDLVDNHQNAEQAYLILINQLLEAYAGHLRPGSPLQAQVRMLQARLQPPLTAMDMTVLRDYVERYAVQITSFRELDENLFKQAVEPLLASFGILDPGDEPAEAVTPLHTAAAEAVGDFAPDSHQAVADVQAPVVGEGLSIDGPAEEEPAAPVQDSSSTAEATQDEAPAFPRASYSGHGTGTPIQGEAGSGEADDMQAENHVDTAYRSHLDSKRRDILKLQATLAEQVLGTIARNEEFGVLLEVVLGELRQAGDGRELEDLRWTLIREIEKLTKGHHELAEQLDSTHHYLQLIESDSRQLSDELTRVRLLSLTDELTGLPNRRAFLRRIEDEVARVQRYGFPLSLSLIDLDHFKQVNDKYGHAGGDEVLQLYSKNILSIFRHHDLVARYGGEEFAVLLPNTDAEGAMRALTKVKNRAAETRWQPNGQMIPVPSFSSGVSLYKPGETASAFIERADKALYRAKRLGRNRVEIDATYQSEAEAANPEDMPSSDDASNQN